MRRVTRLALTAIAAAALALSTGCIQDKNSGIVLDKDIVVQPWGNTYWLLINGPGPENIHWAEVGEADWLDCQAIPNTPYNWKRGSGCT